MKMIEAVIHHLSLQEVTSALDDIGVVDFMVTPILCHGGNDSKVMAFRGAQFAANVAQKVKLEVLSHDNYADRIIRTISSIVKMGCGDGCRIGIRPYVEVTL